MIQRLQGRFPPPSLRLQKNQLVNVKSTTVEQKLGLILQYTRVHTYSIELGVVKLDRTSARLTPRS